VWGRLHRRHEHPPKDHHSFNGHEAILSAIKQRDTEAAFNTMKEHLKSVNNLLFPSD